MRLRCTLNVVHTSWRKSGPDWPDLTDSYSLGLLIYRRAVTVLSLRFFGWARRVVLIFLRYDRNSHTRASGCSAILSYSHSCNTDRRAQVLIAATGVSPNFLGLTLHRSIIAEHHQLTISSRCFALSCLLINQAWRVAQIEGEGKNRKVKSYRGLARLKSFNNTKVFAF